jgi:hypothetical protein
LNDEPTHIILSRFIQHSVNFWIKVIPRQNEESKYSMEALSQKGDYFANIILQHKNQ